MKETSFPEPRNIVIRAVSSALATILCSVILIGQSEHGEGIKHYEYGVLDRFHACAESVFRRHVLTYSAMGHEFENVKCPLNENEFTQELKSKGPYAIISDDEWAFIIPRSFLSEKINPIGSKQVIIERPWKGLRVDAIVTNYSGSESPLNSNQLSELKTRLLNTARFVPIEDVEEGFHDETAVFRLWYQVYVLHLSKSGPLSVVILERQTETPSARSNEELEKQPFYLPNGRLIYGEMHDGEVRLFWDSPVVQVRHMKRLDFQDVDGDGNKETLVRGTYTVGPVEWQALTIFDVSGNELTRQNCTLDMDTSDDFFDAYGGRACPIHGTYVSLDCKSPPCSIEWGVDRPAEDSTTYKLVGGRYISPELANMFHSEGMVSMKAKNWEGALAYFVEAARQNPASAEYANDSGFAYYKMEKYEDSVAWFKQAIGIDSKRAVAYLNLGDALAKLKRNAEARDAYKKYLELAADSKAAPEVKKKLEALPVSP